MKNLRISKKPFFGNSKRSTPEYISKKRKEAMIATHKAREKAINNYSSSIFAFQFTSSAAAAKKSFINSRFKK